MSNIKTKEKKATKIEEEENLQEETEKEEVQSMSMIEKANEAAERLEKANKRQEELIKQQEALAVENTLSGTATAGTTKELSKDEKITQECKELLKGTGFEDRF